MQIISVLKKKKNNNKTFLLLWNEFRRIKDLIRYQFVSDEKFISKMYFKQHKRFPNLVTPSVFTEKIQWLKINYRNTLISQCADKYAVRDYVKECGLTNILNPLIAVYNSAEEIDYSILPNKFVLKGAHGSGWNIICKDKNSLDIPKTNRLIKSWLKQNLYYSGREWVYKEIPHRIVCEKFIESNEEDLKDYKIFCFSGKPKYIQVDGDRFIEHKRAYYDLNWNRQDFQYGGYAEGYKVKRPEKLNEMLSIAEKLSKPFPFSRIDLYNIGSKIIFGEITFYPDAGFATFEPSEIDQIMGNLLVLPSKE